MKTYVQDLEALGDEAGQLDLVLPEEGITLTIWRVGDIESGHVRVDDVNTDDYGTGDSTVEALAEYFAAVYKRLN